jgi:hypothetical protein
MRRRYLPIIKFSQQSQIGAKRKFLRPLCLITLVIMEKVPAY